MSRVVQLRKRTAQKTKKIKKMSRNIRTLGDVRGQGANDSGQESDGEEQQPMYVGGSEHSGQQVLGPPRDRRAGGVLDQVFDSARENGAETMPSEEPARGSSSKKFPGGGARLATEGSGSGSSSSSEPVTDESEPDPVVRLNMWEDGFSIDDGPLRSFEDPATRPFLEDIMRGRIPGEILALHRNRQIDLRMERKSGPYVAPKPKPFQGSGARLGAVVPTLVSSSAPEPKVETPNVDEAAQALKKAQDEVNLTDGAPVTQIQIRLSNGQRLIGKFNHEHTVGSVRTFIVSAVPDLAFSPFHLMTTFPNKIIDDETQSLKDAGLLNSVIVVKPSA